MKDNIVSKLKKVIKRQFEKFKPLSTLMNFPSVNLEHCALIITTFDRYKDCCHIVTVFHIDKQGRNSQKHRNKFSSI